MDVEDADEFAGVANMALSLWCFQLWARHYIWWWQRGRERGREEKEGIIRIHRILFSLAMMCQWVEIYTTIKLNILMRVSTCHWHTGHKSNCWWRWVNICVNKEWGKKLFTLHTRRKWEREREQSGRRLLEEAKLKKESARLSYSSAPSGGITLCEYECVSCSSSIVSYAIMFTVAEWCNWLCFLSFYFTHFIQLFELFVLEMTRRVHRSGGERGRVAVSGVEEWWSLEYGKKDAKWRGREREGERAGRQMVSRLREREN